MPIARILSFVTFGSDGVGPVEAVGVRIGDAVITAMTPDGSNLTDFEEVVTVDDEIQQIVEDDLSESKMLLQVSRE